MTTTKAIRYTKGKKSFVTLYVEGRGGVDSAGGNRAARCGYVIAVKWEDQDAGIFGFRSDRADAIAETERLRARCLAVPAEQTVRRFEWAEVVEIEDEGEILEVPVALPEEPAFSLQAEPFQAGLFG